MDEVTLFSELRGLHCADRQETATLSLNFFDLPFLVSALRFLNSRCDWLLRSIAGLQDCGLMHYDQAYAVGSHGDE